MAINRTSNSPPANSAQLRRKGEKFYRKLKPSYKSPATIKSIHETIRERRMPQDRCHLFFEQAPVGYVFMDRTGRLLEVNLTAASLLGIECRPLTGRAFTSFLDSSEHHKFTDFYNAAFNTGSNQQEVFALAPDNFGTNYVCLEAVALPQENLCQVAITDINGLKNSAKVIRDLISFNEDLIKSNPFPLAILNSQAKVIYMSPLLEEVCGKKISTDLYCWNIMHDNPQECPDCPAKQLTTFRENENIVRETVYCTNDYEIMHTRISYQGEAALLVMYIDITKRKRNELLVEASEKRLRKVTNHAPVLLALIDYQEKYLFVNSNYAQAFNVGVSEIIGKTVAQIMGEQAYAVAEPHIKEALQGKRTHFDMKRPDSSGEGKVLHVSYVPDFNASGHCIGLFAAISDITHRVQVMEENRSLEAQLHQAQKMEAIGHLAGGIAHDFNNILTIINGYGELLGNSLPAGSKGRKDASMIVDAGERAAKLTRQLLAYSRKQLMEVETFDLGKLVLDFEKLLQQLVSLHIKFIVSTPKKPIFVHADQQQIQQVLLNLVSNANDAISQEPGQITLHMDEVFIDAQQANSIQGLVSGKYGRFTVSDNGCGITKEIQLEIFNPFFTTKPAERGTGLGLSTCYGIVKQLGGYIDVNSKLGEGTEMVVLIPSSNRVEDPIRSTSIPLFRTTVLTGKKIMVVDDETVILNLIIESLRSCGAEVLYADCIPKARELWMTSKGTIDLLICDVGLPGGNGMSLAGELLSEAPKLRVLYISGYNELVNLDKDKMGPMQGILKKPFTPSILLSRVAALMRSAISEKN